ncbi:MAG: hypothetical protein KGK07_10420, partial [Chloroflexota bacterium]|nr:hypothetical protein [Chloroflexota bacterium]
KPGRRARRGRPGAVSARAERARTGAGGASTGLACPDCGAVLFFAEGCLVCRSCGYTKCG